MPGKKPVPKSILIFGAAGHIGGPLAEFLHKEAPDIRLRLATTKESNLRALQENHPYAEVVCANYLDLASLRTAIADMEGVFVVTTTGTDEELAMSNLVTALKDAGCVVHVQRILGLIPMANPYRIPDSIRKAGMAMAIQHVKAKEILDASGLPVTYLNLGATMMDNFFKMKRGLAEEHKLIWHSRKVPYIAPGDIAEVAGRLFLSDNEKHIGIFHVLNNGQDNCDYHETAKLMSDVFGVTITCEDSYEAFAAEYGSRFGPRLLMVWEMFEYEKANEEAWALNDFVERTLGRRPKSLREWLTENKEALLG